MVDDVLLPVRGTTLRSALALPGPSHGAELDGVGLAFAALTDAEDDGWTVARCVNVSDESVAGRWRFGFPVREARLARLDEQPLGPLEVSEAGDVPFVAAPRQAVTILVR